MIGVSIQVKGKAVGTVTNIDGNYRLVLPNNSDAIVVTYVGYVPQEISLKNNNWQRIVLKEDANMLDAVVVVGYGTVKKRDLTGAISTVKADEMGLTGVSSIGHALEEKQQVYMFVKTALSPVAVLIFLYVVPVPSMPITTRYIL